MKKVRWGVLSTAKIAREKVIPAMQQGKYSEVTAIGSANKERVEAEADKLKIPRVHHSYEELLNDPEVDAIYNPLPNHMHVEWSVRALQAGKHVLCEKPVALSYKEAETLLQASKQYPGLKVMEAFMYRFHPQWVTSKQLVKEGRIGELKTVHSFFSYFNVDPANIRNRKDIGGGGMMDIGCYCISLARFICEAEPQKVFGTVEFDPVMQTDRLASGILDFNGKTSTFTCSTQLFPYQRVNICGTEGRIEIEIPFNAPPASTTRLWLHTKNGTEELGFDPIDQYTLQGDLFSKAILDNTKVPTDLQDAVNNMKVIELIFASSEQGRWIVRG